MISKLKIAILFILVITFSFGQKNTTVEERSNKKETLKYKHSIGSSLFMLGNIFADESTGNLNSKQSQEIMELFAKLNEEGVTIIQATHSEENAAYGSRIVNLLDGKIAPIKEE